MAMQVGPDIGDYEYLPSEKTRAHPAGVVNIELEEGRWLVIINPFSKYILSIGIAVRWSTTKVQGACFLVLPIMCAFVCCR